ncbi:hypothetical protein D3C85_1272470 [compost metagenome]
MIGDVEAVLGLVDVRRELRRHVGPHDRLITDLQPAVHQPVLVLGIDRHVGRTVAEGEGGGDLAAQHAGVEVQRLAALALEAETGDDLHRPLRVVGLEV